MVNKVIVSIGCNIDCKQQLQRIRECLKKMFPDVRFTDPVVSKDVNGGYSVYSNMLAEFTTSMSEHELEATLKQIETDLGNTQELRSQGFVMMDLDLLQYNKVKHHLSDWSRPYIQTLLKRLLLVILILHSSLFTLHSLAQGDSAKTLLSKAIEYYTGQKYHECILSFKELEKHYKLNPRYTSYLGYSYYKVAEYKDAVQYLEKGIPELKAYSPFEQAAYIYACAESYFNLQEYEKSLPWYQKALPLVNGIDKGDVYYHTGFSHYMLGDNGEAYQNLFKADSIYNDSIYGASLDKQHIARRAQTRTMLGSLKKYK